MYWLSIILCHHHTPYKTPASVEISGNIFWKFTSKMLFIDYFAGVISNSCQLIYNANKVKRVLLTAYRDRFPLVPQCPLYLNRRPKYPAAHWISLEKSQLPDFRSCKKMSHWSLSWSNIWYVMERSIWNQPSVAQCILWENCFFVNIPQWSRAGQKSSKI